jgi:hypothetical protein
MASLAETLTDTWKKFDPQEAWGWVAEGFAAESALEKPGFIDELLEEISNAGVKTVADALLEISGYGPFAPWAIACLAQRAGLGSDVTHQGLMRETPTAIVGNLTVDGPLVCDIENWLLVTGDVKADCLITSSDVIIGGRATFRDGIIGVNSWNQSLWVRGPVEAGVFVSEDYMCMTQAGEPTKLSDADELLAPGVAELVREKNSSDGPDGAVQALLELLEAKKPVFAGR